MFKELIAQPNGWIEASAGTGKTYAIQHMVLEVLRSSDVLIDEILLVTFTEKAAGEMRERIREGLVDALRTEALNKESLNDVELKRVKRALRNFETAEVYTIHGWCKKVLQNIPFESGRSFQERLVDEKELILQVFNECLKGKWSKEKPEIIKKSITEKFITLSYNISSRFFDVIEKSGEGDSVLGEFITPFSESVTALKETLGGDYHTVCVESGKSHLYTAEHFKQEFNKGKKLPVYEKWIDGFWNQLPAVLDVCSNENAPDALLTFVESFKKEHQNPAWFREKRNSPEFDLNDSEHFPHCTGLSYDAIVEPLTGLITIAREYKELIKVQEILPLLNDLRTAVEIEKEAQSLFTFNDMIHRVHTAVTGDETIATRIRGQYRYALVDEFQDTDTAQWEIFSTLFLKTQHTKLFLIGDPKQAIYSFRGADIDTYFRAKAEMLAFSGDAVQRTLQHNYRSSERILTAFNALFSHKNFFGTSNDAQMISYESVQFPKDSPVQDGQSFYTSQALSQDYKPFVVKSLENSGVAAAREEYFPWMIASIKDIKQRGFDWGDIAILVEKRKSALDFEQLLKKEGIPYSFYKQAGVYQSEEAAHLCYVLESISDSSPAIRVKAMLTPFFSQSVSEIEKALNDPILGTLYERWNALIAQKSWGALYASLLNDSHVIERISDTPTKFRTLDTYKQIMQELQSEAYKNKLSIEGQVQLLKNWMAKRVEQEDDGELFRKERDDSAVQILTMHASKGLEFNIVFIGDFGEIQTNEYRVLKQGTHRQFDISQKEGGEERLPEYTRLLYVALTRAKYFLYMPLIPNVKGRAKPVGLNRILVPALQGLINGGLTDYAEVDPVYSIQTSVESKEDNQESTNLNSPFQTSIPEYHGFSQKKIIMESYSHLSHSITESDREVSDLGVIETAPRPAQLDKYIQDIPRGAEPGNCLHDIFEHISFALMHEASQSDDAGLFLLGHPESGALISECCTKYGIGVSHHRAIARLVHNTLTAPMIDSRDSFNTIVLSDIPVVDLKAEMEFQFSYAHTDLVRLFTQGEDAHFVKGFIDLLFRVNGRYYILDWKSNYLVDGYKASAIEASMIKDHYDIQLKVYSLALHKWLKSVMPDYTFEKNFGGVYYVYIRGMQPGSNDGYVCMCPESANIVENEYANEIKSMIANTHPEVSHG